MCVSARPAEFAATSLYLGKKMHPQHGEVFVFGYQNTAHNLSHGPNAMLIHLPTHHFSQENLLDTHRARTIFQNMRASVRDYDTLRSSRGPSAKSSYQIVHHSIYTIIIAQDATAIPEAMMHVEPRKRVSVSGSLIEFYARHYSKHLMTLWCFDNQEAQTASATFLWYTSFHPDFFMLPAVDAHTGNAPDLQKQVLVDHWVFLGSDEKIPHWDTFTYDTAMRGDVLEYLPRYVTGKRFGGYMNNGDFVAPLQNILNSGTNALMRYTP